MCVYTHAYHNFHIAHIYRETYIRQKSILRQVWFLFKNPCRTQRRTSSEVASVSCCCRETDNGTL